MPPPSTTPARRVVAGPEPNSAALRIHHVYGAATFEGIALDLSAFDDAGKTNLRWGRWATDL
jgi:hypothetical protein